MAAPSGQTLVARAWSTIQTFFGTFARDTYGNINSMATVVRGYRS